MPISAIRTRWLNAPNGTAHPGTRVRWVTGTPTERAVPFGAFSHLVRIAE
ncbi:hypothetical protein MAHJHV59_50390 [Mycobacterium avium subsp. hominissuis]